MKDNSAVIVNLTEQSWTLHRSYGTFTVRGAESDAPGGGAESGRAESGWIPRRCASWNDERVFGAASIGGRSGAPGGESNGTSSGESNGAINSAANGVLDRAAGNHAVAGVAVQIVTRAPRLADLPYTLTRVTGRNALMDLGDKRAIDVPISALEVAQDLCHEINSDGGEDSYFGVFVTEHDEPTEDELNAARLRLETFYRRLVAAADREWERSHSFLFINDVERRAAQYLGLEKEWFYQARELADCPACGEKVKPGVAVCKKCGAILDREKAAAHGLGLAPVAAGTAAAVQVPAVSPAPAAAMQPASAAPGSASAAHRQR
jgi:hypothetical protein